MKLCGSGISVQGLLRIAEGEARRERETRSAVIYISDALRMITENTANLSGGRYITASPGQIFPEREYTPSDADEEGEEVIARIRHKLGL